MGGAQAEFRKKFRDNAEKQKSRLILALDTKDPKPFYRRSLLSNFAAVKVHYEMTQMWEGPNTPAIMKLKYAKLADPYAVDGIVEPEYEVPIILDAKLADIDSSNAMKTRFHLSHGCNGVYDAIICHGISGQKAVEAIVNVANELGKGVFLLTAMTSPGHLFDSRKIEALARMAKELDVAGVVAPGNQYGILRKVRRLLGPEILIISPGIGVQGGEAEKALMAGADFAIVGRQIVEAEDPAKIAIEIKDTINRSLESVKSLEAQVDFEYEELVSVFVEKEVLRFGSFTLKSKRPSAYFFNAGKVDDGKSITAVAEAYADMIHKEKLHGQFDVLFGPAYKGIPIVTYVAQALWIKYGVNMRFAYDRKEEKTHGDATKGAAKDKLIVGDVRNGDRILLLDDVITTGGTKFETKEKLDSLGLELKVAGVLILFDRQETDLDGNDPLEIFEAQGIKTYVVLNAKETFEYLKNREVDGKVVVNDELYAAFQTHQAEFGRK
jgi:orotate phosphoribosyltransferase